MYNLDRNSFKAGKFEDADNHSCYYKKLSAKERFKISIYLNSISYKLVGEVEPKMDKLIFSMRKHKNG